MKWLLIIPVVIYRLTLSRLMPPICRFRPTCADYMYRALLRHGALRGLGLGLWRLCRCQPFCKGGFDPVPGDAIAPMPPGYDPADRREPSPERRGVESSAKR